jgi:hypothetical protein
MKQNSPFFRRNVIEILILAEYVIMNASFVIFTFSLYCQRMGVDPP